jgi:tetraprenyl-beta-curcumene synthase
VYRPEPEAPPTSTRPARFPHRAADAAPLSVPQVRALLACAGRELCWGLPAVAREERRWRALARKIPDPPLRADALGALGDKRGQTDGAALFTILPRARNRSLLRLLVAYQVIWDFLDSVNERAAGVGIANGRQLHLALLDALDPGRPLCDYYRHHPWREDGGYLRALVVVCRQCCRELPSYPRVRPLVLAEAARARQVLAANHELDPDRRDAALRAWAREEFPQGHEAGWFELSGAASAGLTIYALLALAAEPECGEAEIDRTRRAYFPWVASAATMLDSYVDEAHDRETGHHVYISHYLTHERAIQRIRLLVRRVLRETGALDDGEKHTLIAACMVAMYLSKDSARTPAMRLGTRRLVLAGGSLPRVLLPILRLWRIAYSYRST